MHGILAEPPRPTWDRRCEKCGQRCALEWISDRVDAIAERIDTYRCTYCGVEIEYAKSHPPHAI